MAVIVIAGCKRMWARHRVSSVMKALAIDIVEHDALQGRLVV